MNRSPIEPQPNEDKFIADSLDAVVLEVTGPLDTTVRPLSHDHRTGDRTCPGLVDADKFRAWAFRIARDRIYREYRRRKLPVQPLDETDLEALILEDREIRRLQPRFNTVRQQRTPRYWIRRPVWQPSRSPPRLELSIGPGALDGDFIGPFRNQAQAQRRDAAGYLTDDFSGEERSRPNRRRIQDRSRHHGTGQEPGSASKCE